MTKATKKGLRAHRVRLCVLFAGGGEDEEEEEEGSRAVPSHV